jgi:cytochrome P450
MGANLARMEIRVILDEVLDRLENFELAGPVERVRTNKHAGVCRVPMRFAPR